MFNINLIITIVLIALILFIILTGYVKAPPDVAYIISGIRTSSLPHMFSVFANASGRRSLAFTRQKALAVFPGSIARMYCLLLAVILHFPCFGIRFDDLNVFDLIVNE